MQIYFLSILKQSFILSHIFLLTLLLGCSGSVKDGKKQILFETRIEAERMAEDLNCTGAHKMGDMWMPCESHNTHAENSHQH